MAVRPSYIRVYSTYNADTCTAGSSFVRVESDGILEKTYTLCHADVTTADNNITIKRAGTQIGAMAHVLTAADVTTGVAYGYTAATASVTAGDVIEFASGGEGSGTVPVTYYAIVRELTR